MPTREALKGDLSLTHWLSRAACCRRRDLVGVMTSLPFGSVQSLSRVQLFISPWTAPHLACLFFTNTRSLLKFMSIELVMPSNRLILCCPLLLPPAIFPSIRAFSNESVLCIRWPNYWSFSFSLSNEYSGLIFFRIDWLDLLAVQGTLKSLLHYHSSKALILWPWQYRSSSCIMWDQVSSQ